MALSRGAKIAIGCGVAFVGAVVAAAMLIFGAAWWGYGKAKQAVKEIEGDQKRIEEARARANANPFTPPADGVIQEDRLVKFLAVRRKLYDVYGKYKDVLEQADKRGKANPMLFTQAFSAINELRTVSAEGLAEQGMSEDEYRYLIAAVYKTALGGNVTGGHSLTGIAKAVAEAAAQQAEQAAAGSKNNPDIPESAKQQLREAARQTREQVAQAHEAMKEMQVPPQNVVLFKKYEREIRHYAMSGLEMLGL